MSKHFLFTNGDFGSPDEMRITKQWVDRYCTQLAETGQAVEHFSPWTSRVEIGDTVHVFGLRQVENWIRFHQIPVLVFVYSLPTKTRGHFVAPPKWKLGYDWLRRKFSQRSENLAEILQAVDGFILNAEDLRQVKMVIEKKNILAIAESPELTAQQFLRFTRS
jgi:hypothetical protein